MISLFKIILSYCKNDITEAEKILQELREDALEIEQDVSSEDEDKSYSSETEVESEDYDEGEMEEEVLTIVRDNEGHYKLM